MQTAPAIQSFMKPFGAAHLLILTMVLAIGLLMAQLARRFPAQRGKLRWLLVLVSACLGLTWYIFRIWFLRQPLAFSLPLEICDVALWITVAALLGRGQRLLELAYFWGISGAAMALLTPYLIAPLVSVPSITFLAGHAMILVDVSFLVGAGWLRLRPRAWVFAMGTMNLLALFDFGFDRLTGANYMYLLHKPPVRSLLDLMGPWPAYIFVADAVAAAIFFGLQLPFHGQTNSSGSAKCADQRAASRK